jgi:hypothetical protein
MASEDSSAGKKFRFEFQGVHNNPCLLQITKGPWHIETDGNTEFDIVSEEGKIIASVDAFYTETAEAEANVQCLHLVPDLVRGIYTAMRALRGALPDNETEETVAYGLADLLKRCYSSPELGDTITP